MVMSHCLRSLSLSGLPRPCADAAPAANTSAMAGAARILRVNMFDLAFAVDRPTCRAVVVLVWKGEWRRDRFARLAPHRDELGTQRLHIAAVVVSAALQNYRLAIPPPRHDKARKRLVGDRPLQRGFAPALAAIRRDHDFADASGPRIGHAGNRVDAGLFEI